MAKKGKVELRWGEVGKKLASMVSPYERCAADKRSSEPSGESVGYARPVTNVVL